MADRKGTNYETCACSDQVSELDGVQEVLFVLVIIFLLRCGDTENNPSPQSSEMTPSAMNLHPDNYNVLKVGPHRTAYLPTKVLKTLIPEVA